MDSELVTTTWYLITSSEKRQIENCTKLQ